MALKISREGRVECERAEVRLDEEHALCSPECLPRSAASQRMSKSASTESVPLAPPQGPPKRTMSTSRDLMRTPRAR